jgi:hypothetical protein
VPGAVEIRVEIAERTVWNSTLKPSCRIRTLVRCMHELGNVVNSRAG